MGSRNLEGHRVVSREEWLIARKQHLVKEKELTRLRDELSRDRRDLPWVRIEKDYVFDGPNGKETLGDLFDGRSQLIVQHFMFAPDWQAGCRICSFGADHVDGAIVHLARRDVTYVTVSRAPLPKIEAFKERMGWRFKWVSLFGSDFNYDFHVSFTQQQIQSNRVYFNYDFRPFESEELAGTSVFFKNQADDVFHTYSCFGRGGEFCMGTYNYLDVVPKGRDEDDLAFPMSWVRHHDSYDKEVN
jgi:predicted dithiol-disulfide oxidoreductase (DUF899 family)